MTSGQTGAALRRFLFLLALASAVGACGPRRLSDPRLNDLVRELRDPSPARRLNAAGGLAQAGAAAAEVVPELTRALKDAEPGVRWYAARALGNAGRAAARAVGSLSQAVRDEDVHVREDAALALGKIGRAEKQAITALVTALGDSALSVREAARGALGRLDPSGRRARETATSLGYMNPSMLLRLTKALREEAPEKSIAACMALAKQGHRARQAAPCFREHLGASNPRVRRALLQALCAVDPDEKAVVGALRVALQDLDGGVKTKAARLLTRYGPSAAEARPELVRLLDDFRLPVRAAALAALDATGLNEANVIDAIARKLADPVSLVRRDAARVLGRRGVAAKRAVPLLKKALKDKSAEVRTASAKALELIQARR